MLDVETSNEGAVDTAQEADAQASPRDGVQNKTDEPGEMSDSEDALTESDAQEQPDYATLEDRYNRLKADVGHTRKVKRELQQTVDSLQLDIVERDEKIKALEATILDRDTDQLLSDKGVTDPELIALVKSIPTLDERTAWLKHVSVPEPFSSFSGGPASAERSTPAVKNSNGIAKLKRGLSWLS